MRYTSIDGYLKPNPARFNLSLILLILGLFPKIAHIVVSVLFFVLGGAGIVMFGMVTATGIRILPKADLFTRFNQYIVAISIGIGLIPVVAPKFLMHFLQSLELFLKIGILLATLSAVLRNILFNGLRSQDIAQEEMAATSKMGDLLH